MWEYKIKPTVGNMYQIWKVSGKQEIRLNGLFKSLKAASEKLTQLEEL